MPLAAWPGAVGYAAQQGSWRVQQRHVPNIVTQMNSGTTRRRRKYTLRVARIQFDIVMNATELAAFNTFYDSTLGDGAERFTMNVWNGAAYVSRTCCFEAPPQFNEYAHLMVKVSFDLRVESL